MSLLDTQRDNLEEIWNQFDFDADGILSAEENESLCRNYFKAVKKSFPEMLDAMVASIFSTLLVTSSKDGVLEKMVQAVREKTHPLLDQFNPLLSDDCSNISREIWASMDMNKDGKVTFLPL